jgi:Tfp pilus assembly protein PilF
VYYKQGKLDLAEQTLRKAAERIQTDGTVHSHLGEVFAKEGKLKLAAAQWERAMDEYGHSLPSDNDPSEVAETQKKLESARVKLAKQNQSALKEQQ